MFLEASLPKFISSFLGSSGQMVNDIAKYVVEPDRIQILNDMLKYGHLAPTSPDTLGCYPYYKEDPFIVTSSPNVLFAGNQPKFQTRLVEGKFKYAPLYAFLTLCKH